MMSNEGIVGKEEKNAFISALRFATNDPGKKGAND
jgi:hypothetical protein